MKSFSRWNGVELVSLPKSYYGSGVFGQKLAYLFFLVLGQTIWLQFCGIIFLPWSHWLLGSRVTDGRLCPTICHWDHLQGRGQRHCKGPGDIEHLGNCLGLAMQLLSARKKVVNFCAQNTQDGMGEGIRYIHVDKQKNEGVGMCKAACWAPELKKIHLGGKVTRLRGGSRIN